MGKTCQNTCFNFGFFIISTLFITLLLYFSAAQSQEIQNYNSCEKIDGNYRSFGNSCTDQCLPQFNKYLPCVNEARYGCDCGSGNCFYQNKCISKAKFTKIYKKILKSQQKQYSDRIDKMVELMKSDPAYSKFVHDLFANYKDSRTKELKSQAQLMSEKFKDEATQYVQAQQQAAQQNSGSASTAAPKAAPVIPAPVPQAVPVATKIPQFYIDNQEKESAPQAFKLPASELDMIFPVVPLPGAATP